MIGWEEWRLSNMAVAFLALVIHILAFWLHRLWRHLDEVGLMGYMAVVAWCGGYLLATTAAITADPGAPAGPWTAIMSVPLGWSLATGVFLWRRSR